MAPEDRAFVARSWVKSFNTSDMAQLISREGYCGPGAWMPAPEFYSTWGAVVSKLLDRARTMIAVDDVGLIAAFVCWEPFNSAVCIHYVYSRLMHRQMGYARALVESLPRGPVYYTHRSHSIGRTPEGWTFTIRPLLALLEAA